MGRIILPLYDSYGGLYIYIYPVASYFRCFPLYRLAPLLQLGLLKQASERASEPLHPLQRPSTDAGVTLARVESAGRAVNYQEGILIKFFMVAGGRLQFEGLT